MVNSISKNFFYYSLKNSNIIQLYQLSSENYNDDIFIHPPVFVYTLYLFQHWLHLSLPISIVIIHLLTSALIFPLVIFLLAPIKSNLLNSNTLKMSDSSIIGLWAVVIYCFCPITSFCSQKVWIDNMAALVVTISATIHVFVTLSNVSLYYFLSGLTFGLLALNTKVTCLALFPFLLLWTIFRLLHFNQQSIKEIILKLIYFIIGIIFGYLPWMILYYVSKMIIIIIFFIHHNNIFLFLVCHK